MKRDDDEIDMTGDPRTVAQKAREAAERAGWVLRAPQPELPAESVEAGSVPLGGSRTRSGFYFPDAPSVPDEVRADELTAAEWFPRVDGARVLHVHVRGGGFAVGGRVLTAGEFHEEVVARLGLPEGEPLIIVGCRAAAEPADGSRSVVAELARLSGRR